MNTRLIVTLIVSLTVIVVCAHPTFAQEVTVTQALVCRHIVDRMPVEPGEVIPAGVERVFCYTQVDGARGETEITHNWYYEGNLMASVALPVRAPAWRTWSSKAMRPQWTGAWMVEVLAKDGTPLESVSFTIQ